MNTCKTCKHWKQTQGAFDKSYHGENSGACDSDKFVYSQWDGKVPEDGLSYWDDEIHSAGFMTGGNFGCIHHVDLNK